MIDWRIYAARARSFSRVIEQRNGISMKSFPKSATTSELEILFIQEVRERGGCPEVERIKIRHRPDARSGTPNWSLGAVRLRAADADIVTSAVRDVYYRMQGIQLLPD